MGMDISNTLVLSHLFERLHDAKNLSTPEKKALLAAQDALVKLERGFPAEVVWCNDCEHGRADDGGIMCTNPDSEWWAEWRGTYDSCEHCRMRNQRKGG